MRHLFMLSTALLLTACACTKNSKSPQLPPITQEGKNTFGCKINGEIFNPLSTFKISGRRISANYYISINTDSKLYLSVYDEGVGIEITLTNPLIEKKIYSINTNKNFARLSDRRGNYYSYNSIGHLEISRIDTIENIIAGTFEFDAQEEGGGEILKVTEGRFDLKLQIFNQ